MKRLLSIGAGYFLGKVAWAVVVTFTYGRLPWDFSDRVIGCIFALGALASIMGGIMGAMFFDVGCHSKSDQS